MQPLIQREYKQHANIFTGSKVLKALMQRGVVLNEQIENRIKVLKSAQPEPFDYLKPRSSSQKMHSTDATAVGEAATSIGALGNTQTQPAGVARPVSASNKRKPPHSWPALALEKRARSASVC